MKWSLSNKDVLQLRGFSSLLCHEFMQNVPDRRVGRLQVWRISREENFPSKSLKQIGAVENSKSLEVTRWRFPESQADQRPRAVPADEVQQFCKAQGVRIWPFQLVKHDVFKMFKGSISIFALDHLCIEYLSRCLQSDSSVGKHIMHGAYGRSRSYPFRLFFGHGLFIVTHWDAHKGMLLWVSVMNRLSHVFCCMT